MKINNTLVITPSEMDVSIEKIGNEIESFNGKITCDTIGYRRVIECTWSGLFASEMRTLLTALSSSIVNLTYFDPQTGNERTAAFVVSDKKTPAYTLRSGKEMWSELSVSFTEQGG